ncbi:hypothetical protein [Sulfitobacter donghicola]|uniref:Uncharacterized protein n=1 Tax=Sulfitobacter donghicola DSW-25 = KCTC 12864 = JCM 14565 TaxID=1300350 RepID=A0A073INP8_9RHOB|nr:hypothetical protein [Sulfitobacter donghicola]KEJ91091.1 hypothetical protein DSW25_03140 [Sulfitobacter donghicola DSW-25 = KCTC 12864 = JCM 14565]KIN68191.1 hypothetical protein Z948_1919 [Sulfitobacter donghicola DSW-25 = KCTC 12864 = JCM 14565]
MIANTFNRLTTLPLIAHIAAAGVSFAGFQWVKARLDASYAASLHPVDYMTGQTSFSGETIKGYYSEMIETGTLGVYFQTQLIDFGFILAMMCMGLTIGTLVARASREGSWGRKLGLFAGMAVFFGALCDAVENGISFVMLANPTGFADWLALPYSGFATVKFALITLGMLLILLSIICAVTGRVFRAPKIG